MGLDTSHDCWHGSYGGFGIWRRRLAAVAGYELTPRYVSLPWEMFEERHLLGEGWDSLPIEDPLIYLLVHSDCDGVIHPEESRHLAARLEQLAPLMPENEGFGYNRSWRRATERFAAGLRRAAEAGEDVDFH